MLVRKPIIDIFMYWFFHKNTVHTLELIFKNVLILENNGFLLTVFMGKTPIVTIELCYAVNFSTSES